MKMSFKDPGKLRVELPGAALTILDTSKGKLLVLNPMIKTAFALDVGDTKVGPENQATEIFDWIEKIKNTTGQQAQQVGGREINGVEAKGFLLNEQGMAYTLWADAKSGMPLRIEIPLDLGTFKTTVVMSDLVFDEKFDESMFDLQPPAGYLLMNFDVPMFHKPPGEEDIVALLRWYAAKSEGRFPKALDHWMDFAKLAKRSPSVDEKDVMEVMMRVGRTSAFLSAVGASNYAYLGAGGKIGDAQKVVFWYQVEGGTKYRAIYGDLHGADVTRDQLQITAPTN
jgi:outer membrane lipoprotein-sorting protein